MRALLLIHRTECRLLAKTAGSVEPALTTFAAEHGHTGGIADALSAAFRFAAAEQRVGEIGVVLMPDTCDVRRVATPPLSHRDAQRFVSAQAVAIFLERAALHTVVCSAARGGRAWLAAAAPASLLQTVMEEASRAAVRVRFITPVHDGVQRTRRFSGPCLLRDEHVSQVLRFVRGRLIDVRVSRMLETDGEEPISEISPMQAAVPLLGRRVWPRLDFAQKPRSSRRTRLALLAGMIPAFALSASLLAYHTRAELRLTRADRASITRVVAIAASDRNAITREAVRASELIELRNAARPLSDFIVRLAEQLPSDAHLIALIIRGDTVQLEGIAPDTRLLFEDFAAAAVVQNLRVARPVRRILAGDSSRTELFVLEGVR